MELPNLNEPASGIYYMAQMAQNLFEIHAITNLSQDAALFIIASHIVNNKYSWDTAFKVVRAHFLVGSAYDPDTHTWHNHNIPPEHYRICDKCFYVYHNAVDKCNCK